VELLFPILLCLLLALAWWPWCCCVCKCAWCDPPYKGNLSVTLDFEAQEDVECDCTELNGTYVLAWAAECCGTELELFNCVWRYTLDAAVCGVKEIVVTADAFLNVRVWLMAEAGVGQCLPASFSDWLAYISKFPGSLDNGCSAWSEELLDYPIAWAEFDCKKVGIPLPLTATISAV